MDDQHVHVVVEELGGPQVCELVTMVVAHIAPEGPHVWEVGGDDHQTTVVSSFLPASVCDGRYDADDEWRQLGVDAEEQEHRALVGE